MLKHIEQRLRRSNQSDLFPSASQQQRAARLRILAVGTLSVAATALFALVFMEPDAAGRRLASIAVVTLIVGIVLTINRRGHTSVASWIFVLGLVGLVTQRAWVVGGTASQVAPLFILFVMMAGVLLSRMGGIVTAAICFIATAVIIAGQEYGLVLPRREFASPAGMLVFFAMILGLSLALQSMLGNAYRAALDLAEQEIAERKATEIERARLIHELGERVKELKLLHASATTAQRPWPGIDDLLQHVVGLMPSAWQYPESTEARITLGDIAVSTPGWRETEWKQSIPFATQAAKGEIAVVYTERKPDEVEGPFLQEERDLLESLSEMLAAIIDSFESRRDLERLIEARTTELRAARDAAEQAAIAKGAFLANMSHELRTPMNAILGYEQLLQSDQGLTDAQRRKLDVIRTSGIHLLTIINDILDMSRLDAGRMVLSVQTFELHELVSGVETMFLGEIARRRITLDVRVEADVPRVIRADSGKVRQVLINLIANAVKFTDTGGVRVRVSCLRTGQVACVITIEVADTGSGIPSSSFELIFRTFGQAREGASRGGTGLGLSISRNFARMMDGDITVQSTVGRGSTFTFTFAGAMIDTNEMAQIPEPEERRQLAEAARPQLLVAGDIPSDLLKELREAARKARVSRVVELAGAIEAHSPVAAQSIRELADEFRYAELLDALDGAPVL